MLASSGRGVGDCGDNPDWRVQIMRMRILSKVDYTFNNNLQGVDLEICLWIERATGTGLLDLSTPWEPDIIS